MAAHATAGLLTDVSGTCAPAGPSCSRLCPPTGSPGVLLSGRWVVTRALNAAGDAAVPGTGHVLVDQCGPHRSVLQRCMSSWVVTPEAAASWLPVWRRSWKWNPVSKPTAATRSCHFVERPKFPRRSGAPFGPQTPSFLALARRTDQRAGAARRPRSREAPMCEHRPLTSAV